MPKNSSPTITELRRIYGKAAKEHYLTAPPIVKQLAEAIAPLFGLQATDIFIPRRTRNVVDARQVLQFALVRGGDMTLTDAGRHTVIGGADHTTVLHSCGIIGHVSRSVPQVAAALDHAVSIAWQYYGIKKYPCPSITGLHLRPAAPAIAA